MEAKQDGRITKVRKITNSVRKKKKRNHLINRMKKVAVNRKINPFLPGIAVKMHPAWLQFPALPQPEPSDVKANLGPKCRSDLWGKDSQK